MRLNAKSERASFITALQKTGHDAIEKELSEESERISSIYGHYGSGVHLGVELGFNLITQEDNQGKYKRI